MASNKQSKLEDIVDEGFVQSTKVKTHSRSPAEQKTAKGERMFYALLTDGTVYRKIVAFGQASISFQHVEEWKYYVLTILKAKKAKRRQVHEKLHRVHGTGTTKATEITRTGGLKNNCTQLSEVVALARYLLNFINYLTNFIRKKFKKRKIQQTIIRLFQCILSKQKGATTCAILVLLRFNETRNKTAKPLRNLTNLLW